MLNFRGRKIIYELHLVFFDQCQSGFQLDDNSIVNPKIGVILANYLTIIRDADWLLLFDSESCFLKFDAQRVLINLFEESRAELIVDCIGAANDCLSEFVVPSLLSSVRC